MGLGAYLHLRINPNKAIGELEPTRLFYITDKSMILLVNVLSELVQRLSVELDSLTFWLFRIDLCQDCILDHEDDVKAYIRLLHKGSSFHNWRLVSYQDEKDEHSFRRVNQRYQVTAYDKLYQIKDRGQATTWNSDQRILRVEVALLPDGISHIREKLKVEAKDWLTLLQELNYSSAQIICNVLNKLIPQGMYCSLAFAKIIIQNSHFYQHKKQALIEFLSSVNRFSHIDTNELKKRKNGKKRLRQLMALNINPVTIDARSNILFLPSLLPNERNTDSTQ